MLHMLTPAYRLVMLQGLWESSVAQCLKPVRSALGSCMDLSIGPECMMMYAGPQPVSNHLRQHHLLVSLLDKMVLPEHWMQPWLVLLGCLGLLLTARLLFRVLF